jgi:predicted glycosyltransferase
VIRTSLATTDAPKRKVSRRFNKFIIPSAAHGAMAVVVMNGTNLTAGTSIAAFAANFAVFAVVVHAMSRRYQRHRVPDAGRR